MDSGYDNKLVQQTILAKGWHFIMSLKSNPTIWTQNNKKSGNDKNKIKVKISELFQIFKRRSQQITGRLTKAALA